jgi:hypothetical protein
MIWASHAAFLALVVTDCQVSSGLQAVAQSLRKLDAAAGALGPAPYRLEEEWVRNLTAALAQAPQLQRAGAEAAQPAGNDGWPGPLRGQEEEGLAPPAVVRRKRKRAASYAATAPFAAVERLDGMGGAPVDDGTLASEWAGTTGSAAAGGGVAGPWLTPLPATALEPALNQPLPLLSPAQPGRARRSMRKAARRALTPPSSDEDSRGAGESGYAGGFGEAASELGALAAAAASEAEDEDEDEDEGERSGSRDEWRPRTAAAAAWRRQGSGRRARIAAAVAEDSDREADSEGGGGAAAAAERGVRRASVFRGVQWDTRSRKWRVGRRGAGVRGEGLRA